MSYRLSRKAEDDILEVYAATVDAFGIEQAERYIAGLARAFAFLAEYPLVARERRELRPPSRAYRYEAHMIFYRQDADGVFIQRVRHGREDWAGT